MGPISKRTLAQAVHSPPTGMSPSHLVTRNDGFFMPQVSHGPDGLPLPVDYRTIPAEHYRALTAVAHKPSIAIEQATFSYSFQVP